MRLSYRLLADASTGLTGLHPVANARQVLLSAYQSTLKSLDAIPTQSVYRRSTENLIRNRIGIVESNENAEGIETQIGEGLIEELIIQAGNENSLVKEMARNRVYVRLSSPLLIQMGTTGGGLSARPVGVL